MSLCPVVRRGSVLRQHDLSEPVGHEHAVGGVACPHGSRSMHTRDCPRNDDVERQAGDPVHYVPSVPGTRCPLSASPVQHCVLTATAQ
eukprot:11273688-Heterocapsa_arctica.AAC.1